MNHLLCSIIRDIVEHITWEAFLADVPMSWIQEKR
jgi:hypothetical protein